MNIYSKSQNNLTYVRRIDKIQTVGLLLNYICIEYGDDQNDE